MTQFVILWNHRGEVKYLTRYEANVRAVYGTTNVTRGAEFDMTGTVKVILELATVFPNMQFKAVPRMRTLADFQAIYWPSDEDVIESQKQFTEAYAQITVAAAAVDASLRDSAGCLSANGEKVAMFYNELACTEAVLLNKYDAEAKRRGL